MIMTTGICSADSLSVEQVSHLDVIGLSVAVSGNYTYVADRENGLEIFDVSDPSLPELVGKYDNGCVWDVIVSGNYAYLAWSLDGGTPHGSLVIVDISDPSAPNYVGKYDGVSTDLFSVEGNYAYVTPLVGKVGIVDISDPSAPENVGTYYPSLLNFSVTAVSGNYSYEKSGDNIRIVDISDPAAPVIASTYPTDGVVSLVSGNYAYVPNGSRVEILDISDPSSPMLAGTYDTDGSVSAVSGNYAYLTNGSCLEILDISDLSSPELAGTYDTDGSVSAVSGNYVYVAASDGYGLTILRLYLPIKSSNMKDVGQIDGHSGPVTIAGNYAFIGQGDNIQNFVIYNVADIINPLEIGRLNIAAKILSIGIANNYAYLGTDANQILVVDISDPTSPKLVNSYRTSGSTVDIAVSGNYAYSVMGKTLLISDISNPSAPRSISSYYTTDYANDVAVAGNYAYIADSDNGLVIVNVTNPAVPTFAGNYDSGNSYACVVSGNYAYIADGMNGLFIVDVTNPSSPMLMSNYKKDDGVIDVDISGIYAYIISTRGVYALNIANPSSVKEEGGYTQLDASSVVASDNYVYVNYYERNAIHILHLNSAPITTTYSPSYDNRLRESTPTTVLSSSNYIDIGKLSTTSYRDVMMFDLSDYKPTDTISEATLSLYWYYPTSATRTSDTVVEVYRPVEWDPKYVSWKNSASGKAWTNAGGSWYDKNGVSQGTTPYASVTFPAATVPGNKYYDFDVTQLVQDYVSGKYVNTGLFLKAKTESGNYIAFYSSDWTNAAQRPKLTVTSTSGSVDDLPIANAGEDLTATTGSAVSFDGSGSTDDKGIASYSWDFDDSDGITSEATGPTATKTYATAGTYTVTLTVTDTAGQTSADTLQVVVTSPVSSVTYMPTYDNRMRESTPTTVLSSYNYNDIGKLGTARYRDVMMFDLSDYKSTDAISKATLSLYWYYPAGATRTSDTVVEIYRPVEWDPKYVSWKYRASGAPWSTAGGSWYDKNGVAQGTTPYASVTFSGSKVPDNKYYEFDVTPLVREYISGKYTNTGFFLKAKTESGNYIAFYSSEWTNADQKPKLTITR